MKRSRTTALLLMGSVPLLLAACQREQAQEQVQEGLFTSVEACAAQTHDIDTCRKAEAEAKARAADSAPQYASREDCARDYPAEQCVAQQTSAGHSFIGPMMAGFFLSRMLGGGAAAGLAPQSAPAWQDRNAQWGRATGAPGTGGLNTASGIGQGKAGLAPVTSEPNRAVTASRGGFGSSSRGRSYGG